MNNPKTAELCCTIFEKSRAVSFFILDKKDWNGYNLYMYQILHNKS